MAFDSSNRNKLLAGILIILGLLIAITPWYIFPVCEAGTSGDNSGGMKMGAGSDQQMTKSGTHMKCWYTAEAEVVVGTFVALAGIVLLFLKGQGKRRAIGIATIVLGVLTILIPTFLIGVCNTSDAPCRIGTLPALIILGVLTVIAGIYQIIAKDETFAAAPPSSSN
jgi:Domain of unknown function (DUF4418)